MALIFLMQNHAYFLTNMQTAKIYAKNYANGKNLQVNTVRHSHSPTANSAYQQLSSIAHLHLARTRPVRQPILPALHVLPARSSRTTCTPPTHNSEQLILYACRKSKSVS